LKTFSQDFVRVFLSPWDQHITNSKMRNGKLASPEKKSSILRKVDKQHLKDKEKKSN
jgi:hypothetical protein